MIDVKLLMFYHAQTTNLTFLVNMRYLVYKYNIGLFQIASDTKFHI